MRYTKGLTIWKLITILQNVFDRAPKELSFAPYVLPRFKMAASSLLTFCESGVVQKVIDLWEPGMNGNLLLKLIKSSCIIHSGLNSNSLELSFLAMENMYANASILEEAFKRFSIPHYISFLYKITIDI